MTILVYFIIVIITLELIYSNYHQHYKNWGDLIYPLLFIGLIELAHVRLLKWCIYFLVICLLMYQVIVYIEQTL